MYVHTAYRPLFHTRERSKNSEKINYKINVIYNKKMKTEYKAENSHKSDIGQFNAYKKIIMIQIQNLTYKLQVSLKCIPQLESCSCDLNPWKCIHARRTEWLIRWKTAQVEKCSFSLSHAWRERTIFSSIRSHVLLCLVFIPPSEPHVVAKLQWSSEYISHLRPLFKTEWPRAMQTDWFDSPHQSASLYPRSTLKKVSKMPHFSLKYDTA